MMIWLPVLILICVYFQSALVVAVVNIEIPSLLGAMVDIVTRKLMCSAGPGIILGMDSREQDFEFLVRTPALKLIGLYLLQVSTLSLKPYCYARVSTINKCILLFPVRLHFHIHLQLINSWRRSGDGAPSKNVRFHVESKHCVFRYSHDW